MIVTNPGVEPGSLADICQRVPLAGVIVGEMRLRRFGGRQRAEFLQRARDRLADKLSRDEISEVLVNVAAVLHVPVSSILD
jgi:hypothetical protein